MARIYDETLAAMQSLADISVGVDGAQSVREIAPTLIQPCADALQLSPDAGWTASVATYTDYVKIPFASTGRTLVVQVVAKANKATADTVDLSFSADGTNEHATKAVEVTGAAGAIVLYKLSTDGHEYWPYIKRKFTKNDAGAVTIKAWLIGEGRMLAV